MPGRPIMTHKPVAELIPDPRNARTHSQSQIRQIANSITEFGFTNPILIDETNRIIAGHGRMQAATRLGLESVPVIIVSDLSDPQKRALALADNKIALNAGWDQELSYLSSVEIDFDVEITGFEGGEIDMAIESVAPENDDPDADRQVEVDKTVPAVSQPGDLWMLGDHRLLCGDAREPSAFEELMAGEKAQLVVSDPPYNIRIANNVCGKGTIKHREFAMASGEMSPGAFTDFLTVTFNNMKQVSSDGSIHMVFMDWRHQLEILTAGDRVYDGLLNLCVWAKTNSGMGSLYRSQHELIYVFKAGIAPHINNVQLGRHGRNRSNVWTYAGVNTFRKGRMEELSSHPTVKPVAMIADCLRDCSKRGGVVLDPFCGSGTILIAAEKTGRRAHAMEIDPLYLDASIRRWQAYRGAQAVNTKTGLTFAETAFAPTGSPQPDALADSRTAAGQASKEARHG